MSTGHFTDQELKILERKNRFLIQDDMFEDIKVLRDGDIALLMYSIFEYATQGVLPSLDEEHQLPVKMSFNRFKKQHDENLREWLDGRIRKIEAGRKGGLAKGKNNTSSTA